MRRTELSFTTALSILTLSLSGCATTGGSVTVLDKEECVDEGSLGAHCAHLYSGGKRDIGQPDWDNTRFGWFCENPGDTVESKKESEELCSINGVTCSYPAQTAIQSYIHRIFITRSALKLHAKNARHHAHVVVEPHPYLETTFGVLDLNAK